MDNIDNKEFVFDTINDVGKHRMTANYISQIDNSPLTADVVVEMKGPNIRSTEKTGSFCPHLFFKASDGWFLNAKEGGEDNG